MKFSPYALYFNVGFGGLGFVVVVTSSSVNSFSVLRSELLKYFVLEAVS